MFAKEGLKANRYPENAGGTALPHYSLHMTSVNIKSNIDARLSLRDVFCRLIMKQFCQCLHLK